MMEGLDRSHPLSLYIHVPFCTRKCDYCAFYSEPLASCPQDSISRYLDILLKEIHALNEDWKKPYRTIFIGGGNPGILGYGNIRRIVEAASEHGRPEEATAELNPENVTEDIESLSGCLTRISVGIQSLDETTLRTLGRNASRLSSIRALSILSGSSFRWNADIITAVPGESIDDALRDIDGIASFSPGHISYYCLSFEEGTPLIGREKPVGEEMEREFLRAGWKRLRELGYEHYEVSNFAKEGERCMHSEVYWHLGQYAGFGPGAESSVGWREAVSMRENETLSGYLSSPMLTCTPLTAAETEEEFLLTALRTSDGISKEGYRERFGRDFDSVYGSRIRGIPKESYRNSSSSFSLTEEGFLILDWIILHMAMVL